MDMSSLNLISKIKIFKYQEANVIFFYQEYNTKFRYILRIKNILKPLNN